MKNFISIIPNVLSPEDCDAIVADYPTFYAQKSNSVAKKTGSEVALNFTYPEDTEEHAAKKQVWFNKIMPIISEQTYKYLDEYGQQLPFPLELNGCQLQKSSAESGEGYYVFHYECVGAQHDIITRRMLAWMIYLNDVPAGEGETEFLYQGVRIQPKRGDLVIFPAGFTHTHRGNPVYTTDKYIVTGWQLWPTPEDVQAFMDNQRSQKGDIT